MKFVDLFPGIAVLSSITGLALGQCTMPGFLVGTSWWDSDKGLITFSDTNVTGWTASFLNCDVIDSWECYFTETTGTDTYLILRSYDVYTSFNLRAYLCFDMSMISAYSYSYILRSDESLDFNYERVTMIDDTTVISAPKTDLCTAASVFFEHHYHVMVHEGYEEEAKQNCSSEFDSFFRYSITDTANQMTYCSETEDEVWDACTDNQTMTIDYTQCPKKVAYSDSGELSCVYSINNGLVFYQTVMSLNADNTTYSFACMSGYPDGDTLSLSQVPGGCASTQNAFTQPTATDGTVIGLNLQLKRIPVPCDIAALSGGSNLELFSRYFTLTFVVIVQSITFLKLCP